MWLTGRLVPDHKNHRRFPQGQTAPPSRRSVRNLSPCAARWAAGESERRDRRQQIQGGELARQQLHEREDGPPPGADRGERCALSEQLDTTDRQTAAGEEPSEELAARTTRLKEKLAKLEEEVKRLKAIEQQMLAAPDQQISFTDPDSRSMATSGRGSGMVGYNMQAAVDTANHLIGRA